jgi:hypothetical protein
LVHRLKAGQQHPVHEHSIRGPKAGMRRATFCAEMLRVGPKHWLAGGVALTMGVIGCGPNFDSLFTGPDAGADGGSEGGGQGGSCGDGGLGAPACRIQCALGSCDCGSSSSSVCAPTCSGGLCNATCGLPTGCSLSCPVGVTCVLSCTYYPENQVTPQNCPLTCMDGTLPVPCGDKGLLCGTKIPGICG